MDGWGEIERIPDEALATATEAAREAAAELRTLQGILGRDIDTGKIVIEAESASEHAIRDVILDSFPDQTLLFEETLVHSGGSSYTWLIDPLDGTDGFRAGNDEYAVSIALYADTTPVLGVVSAPGREQLFTASVTDPARCDGDRIEVSTTDTLDRATLVSGYDRGGAFLRAAADDIAGWTRRSSAALNLCDVARGHVEGHWEFSTYPWDIAAGLVIAWQAGARVTDVETDAFEPELEPTNDRKSLLASNDEFHERLTDFARTA